ncbi:uncharacterized protein LOC109860838 [Pseudomyrmex gracilis]|uniref:uncharacterized protein LOC109860838 n=1 Tax=Pseudomyrmex gracilis TaxID=219809 RepID=UPI000994AC54|nr:uncharacterized protein LOC109860838 [Pseudomyrmex gracilis]
MCVSALLNNAHLCFEVTDLFNNTFPACAPILKSTVQRTVSRFAETGSVNDRPRSRRPRTATDADNSLEVLQSYVENPHTSLSKAAHMRGISKTSIRKILKEHRFHPFKIKLVYQLAEDDFDRRLEFCKQMMMRIDENNNLLNLIVFSDKATFELNGNVNRHNCRYWSNVNPHWMRDNHTQYHQKLNVWAGISGNNIIGPFFIDGNLNAENYLTLLQNGIVPAIQQLFGEEFDNVWFQQDGAPAHFGLQVRAFFDHIFPEKWIGRRGTLKWPPRSPDLNPLDYFFEGHLKSKVYATKPLNLQDLKNRIRDEVTLITRDQLQNVINSFYVRLGQC